VHRPGSRWGGAVERLPAVQDGHVPGRRVVPGRERHVLPVVVQGLTRRLRPAAPGICPVTARTVQGMAPYPGQARCLALGFWPECFRRLNVKGGRRPFPEETRSALDIEGKHVTIQGPSPDLTSSVSGLLRERAHMRQSSLRCLRCRPRVPVVTLPRPPHAEGGEIVWRDSSMCRFLAAGRSRSPTTGRLAPDHHQLGRL
jgi:hypothetical protein